MESEAKSIYQVSANDLLSSDWQEKLSASGHREFTWYRGLLLGISRERNAAGDSLGERVYGFLSAIASLHFKADERRVPYAAYMIRPDGSRSFSVDDLVSSDLDALSGIVEDIRDANFQARIADILWLRRKDRHAATIAIQAFLRFCKETEDIKRWVIYIDQLTRAVRISAIPGFESEKNGVIAVLEELLLLADSVDGLGDARHLYYRLIKLLLNLRLDDYSKYAVLAERIAIRLSDKKDHHAAERYWECAASVYKHLKQNADAKRCAIAAAECLISEGEGPASDALYASHWIGRGYEALKRANAPKSRIRDAHNRLREVQSQIPDQMKLVELEIPIDDDMRQQRIAWEKSVVDSISGENVRDAILRLIQIASPTNIGTFRKLILKASKGFVSHFISSQVLSTEDNRVQDVIPTSTSAELSEGDPHFEKIIYHKASQLRWPLEVELTIEPARRALLAEHSVGENELHFIIENNPFIPEGHEVVYLRGFLAGFYGDWLVSMHLLIPQTEASIRYVLQQHGVPTSVQDPSGVQEEKSLGWLLEHPKALEIFGEGIIFDLRGILTESSGCNLRNHSAHGLASIGAFYRPECVYLWWLLLHLCLMGHQCIPDGNIATNDA